MSPKKCHESLKPANNEPLAEPYSLTHHSQFTTHQLAQLFIHLIKQIMKAGKFNDLTLADKYWLVCEYADYLLSIEHYDYRVSLYSLNSLYIEVYKNIDTRIIEKISVAGSSELNKYLSRILIGNLKKPVKR